MSHFSSSHQLKAKKEKLRCQQDYYVIHTKKKESNQAKNVYLFKD